MGGVAAGMSAPLAAGASVTSVARPLLYVVAASASSGEAPRSAEERAREAAAEARKAERELSAFLGVSDEASWAYAYLNHALLLASERGQEVPCQGTGSDAWTSDDYDDQRVAADRCLDCPAMLLCERYRALAKPAAGTWAGVTSDRAMKPYVPKARRVVPLASERSDCLCGCGGQPRRGRYLPGHDSIHLRALRGGVLSGHISPDEALADLAHSERLQAKLTRFLGGP